MITLLRLLHLRRLRRQPVRALVAVLSVAAGVALAVSVVVVQVSFDRSLEDFGRSLAGPAPLRVIGPVSRGGLDQAVLADVEATEGVATAVPVVQAVTLADGAGRSDVAVIALGVDCRVEELLGDIGCSEEALAAATAAPFTSDRLRRELGDGATVRSDLGRVSLDGAPALRELDGLNGGRVVVFPLGRAQELFFRPSALDTVYVLPEAGTDVVALRRRLERAVGGWNTVLTAAEAPPGVSVVRDLYLPLFGLLSLFALGIGATLIRNTIALSLEERRRDLAVVAALGATPAMIARGALLEAGALGGLGGLVGTAAGVVTARPLLASMSQFTERFQGLRLDVHTTPLVVAVGAVLGIGVSLLAAWRTARRASRLDVSAELVSRDRRAETAPRATVERGLLFTAFGVAAIGVCVLAQDGGALEPWQPIAGQLAFIVATLALIAAVGAFTPAVSQAGLRVLDRPAVVRLGLANLVREPGRSKVMAVAVGSAVGIAITVSGAARSIEVGITNDILANSAGRVFVSTLPPNNSLNIDAKLPPDVLERLRTFPGVASVDRGFTLLVGLGDGTTIGAVAFDDQWFAFEVLRGTADPEAFERGEVLIGPALARQQGIGAGDTVRLPGRTGFVELPVQGVWRHGDFGGANVAMPVELLTSIWGPQPVDDVMLRPEPGVSTTELARAVQRAELDPDLVARTPAEFVAEVTDEVDNQIEPFWVLQRGMLLMAFVTVLFTLLLAAVQRRREIALLGAIGMQPRELVRMVLAEALAIGIIGTVLGAAAAVGFSLALREVLSIVIGYRDPLRFDLLAPLVWGAVATLVVVVAAAWPAWRMSRIEVLEGLRYE